MECFKKVFRTMFFIIYKYTLLVLIINITSCYVYASCPSFDRSSDGLSARIGVPTPNNHNNSLELLVQLSIGSNVSNEEAKLSFLGDYHDVENNRQLIYNLKLPFYWRSFQKKITKISINNEHVCSSEPLNKKNFAYVTIIDITHRYKITTYITRSSGIGKPSSTTPPDIYSRNTKTNNIPWTIRSPQPSNPYNQKTIQPFKQNYQRNNCYKSSQSNTLIHNGADAQNEMYPWLGALIRKRKDLETYQCGATLITDKIALTAGHCVAANNRYELYLIFGTSDYNDRLNDDIQIVKVKERELHPQYNVTTADADLAILTFTKDLYFTSSVRPICLCNFEDSFYNIGRQRGVVAGWGLDETNNLSTNLQQSYAGIVTNDVCVSSSYKFKDIISDRTFCAGDINGSGPCQGDSGSGFYMFVEGRWTIRGIVSRSLSVPSDSTKCDLFHYIVYLDVAKHLEWIYTFL